MGIYFMPAAFALWAYIVQVTRDKRLDRWTLAIVSATTILICGLRWNADVDYPGYVEDYAAVPALADFTSESLTALYGEAGYLVISAFFKTLGAEFYWLAFTIAALSISLKAFVAYRLASQAALAVCLYLCLHFITIEMIELRWAVAVAILSLGFYFQCLGRRRPMLLCFAAAISLHYFSVLFLFVSLLVALNYKRKFYYAFFFAGFLGNLLFKFDPSLLPLDQIGDSEIYVVKRIVKYVSDPTSYIGVLSYAKILMYATLYFVCRLFKPSAASMDERASEFVFRVSFVSLGITALLSAVPVFHFRAVVFADFFSIIMVVNAIGTLRDVVMRQLAYVMLSGLFVTWYLTDLYNNLNARLLLEYQTWLGMLF